MSAEVAMPESFQDWMGVLAVLVVLAVFGVLLRAAWNWDNDD